MLGIVLAISAALFWGTSTVFSRLGLQSIKASTGALVSLFSSTLLVVLLALIIDFDAVRQISPTLLLWFGLIGIINYVLGRQFNYLSISHLGATKASPLFSSAPLFAIILAVVLIGESVNSAIVIGTVSVVVGFIW